MKTRPRSRDAAEADMRADMRADGPSLVVPRALAWLRARVSAGVRRIGAATLAVFAAAFVFYTVVGLVVIGQIGITGDEPWYLMLGYSLVHHHTANLAAIVNDPQLYHTFLGHWDDHTKDFLGNGERVLPNLPGYALILGICVLLAGRAGIVVLQAGATALTATLLFAEGKRLFDAQGKAAALFATAAFALALPATLYVSQMFPSALASAAAFAGFVLATRVLPASTGRRSLAVASGLGVVCALLPWLHFKYALVALVLLALALLRLRPRLRWPLPADRSGWHAALIVVGINAVSFLLIAVYCRHYFGTWTPQYSPAAGSAMDFAHPNLPRALALYTDMFASNQSGLLPWVPLDLLLLPGAVLLWRRMTSQARAVLALIAAQLAGFLPLLFTPAIYQGFALPARFTVECAPFFALCVAAVFATGWPALRAVLEALPSHMRQLAQATSMITSRLTRRAQSQWEGTVAATQTWTSEPDERVWQQRAARSAQVARVKHALGATTAGIAMVLLLAGGWLLAVALTSPALLYASHAGNRLAEKDAAVVPGWWFAAFPDPGHTIVDRLTLPLAEDGTTGAPSSTPAIRVTGREELPPGAYTATFAWSCTVPASAANATSADVQLTVQRVTVMHPVLAARHISADRCDGRPQTETIARFESDGYDPTRFNILAPPGVTLAAASVSYAPAHA